MCACHRAIVPAALVISEALGGGSGHSLDLNVRRRGAIHCTVQEPVISFTRSVYADRSARTAQTHYHKGLLHCCEATDIMFQHCHLSTCMKFARGIKASSSKLQRSKCIHLDSSIQRHSSRSGSNIPPCQLTQRSTERPKPKARTSLAV